MLNNTLLFLTHGKMNRIYTKNVITPSVLQKPTSHNLLPDYPPACSDPGHKAAYKVTKHYTVSFHAGAGLPSYNAITGSVAIHDGIMIPMP